MTEITQPARIAQDPLVLHAQAKAAKAKFSAALLGRYGLAPSDIPDLATATGTMSGTVDYAGLARAKLAQGLDGFSGMTGGGAPAVAPSDTAMLAMSMFGQGLSDGAKRNFEMIAEYQQRLAQLKEGDADPAAIRAAERVLVELNKQAAQRMMTDALFPDKDDRQAKSSYFA